MRPPVDGRRSRPGSIGSALARLAQLLPALVPACARAGSGRGSLAPGSGLPGLRLQLRRSHDAVDRDQAHGVVPLGRVAEPPQVARLGVGGELRIGQRLAPFGGDGGVAQQLARRGPRAPTARSPPCARRSSTAGPRRAASRRPPARAAAPRRAKSGWSAGTQRVPAGRWRRSVAAGHLGAGVVRPW